MSERTGAVDVNGWRDEYCTTQIGMELSNNISSVNDVVASVNAARSFKRFLTSCLAISNHAAHPHTHATKPMPAV
jgi:hypothetical protein